ncbi:hypothetical protein [Actinophytocola algeriensis]|uniref:Uncharacterized protein n=1 Tax=Actinophytocola algeriensis TaxID=1768010 RepID=A0A7W7VDJ4_9PSEU|nr:hypothetical protein [Actinophytocola algeriensis]MBB4906241.1 hypothetical protein [Actinophytocola algeriensis]MBE1472074.1 hypothetical protein [Actinophytocola algeriensis]
MRRLLTWYLHTANAAQRVLLPELPPIELDDPVGRVPEFENFAEALSWYDAERANLLAAVRQAAAGDHHDIGWRLPMALLGFFNLRRAWG